MSVLQGSVVVTALLLGVCGALYKDPLKVRGAPLLLILVASLIVALLQTEAATYLVAMALILIEDFAFIYVIQRFPQVCVHLTRADFVSHLTDEPPSKTVHCEDQKAQRIRGPGRPNANFRRAEHCPDRCSLW
jgi:hypothetical protein